MDDFTSHISDYTPSFRRENVDIIDFGAVVLLVPDLNMNDQNERTNETYERRSVTIPSQRRRQFVSIMADVLQPLSRACQGTTRSADTYVYVRTYARTRKWSGQTIKMSFF